MESAEEIVYSNKGKIRTRLPEELDAWDDGGPTLAPVESDDFYIMYFLEDDYHLLVLTGEEQLVSDIVSGFVLGYRKEDNPEWKLFIDDDDWGCNTFDNDNLVAYWPL